jgi:hypothetical protein
MATIKRRKPTGTGAAAPLQRMAAAPNPPVKQTHRTANRPRRISTLKVLWLGVTGLASFLATSEIIREIKYQSAETRRIEGIAERNADSIDAYLKHAKKVLRANVVALDSHLPQIYKAEGLDTEVLDKLGDVRRRLLKADPQTPSDRASILKDLIDFKEYVEEIRRDTSYLTNPLSRAEQGAEPAYSTYKAAAEGIHANLVRPFFHLTFLNWCLRPGSDAHCHFSRIWNP